MRKYLSVFGITVQKALMHRGRNFVWVLIGMMSPLIMISVWTKYYSEGNSLRGYTLEQLVGYYLVVLMLSMWVSAVSEHVDEDIKDGNLSNYVIKPFDYMLNRLFWEVAWYSVKFATYAVPAIIALIVFANGIVVNLLDKSFGYLMLLVMSLILGYLISFGISLCVGYIGFFTETTTGYKHLFNMLNELLTGRLIPVVLFPLFLQNILNFLPFKYIVFFPTQMVIGNLNTSTILAGIANQIMWLIGLFLLSKWMWKKGITKFSAVGL